MKAHWKNTLLAESQETLVVEGRHYFPSPFGEKRVFAGQPYPDHLPLERGGRLLRSVGGRELNRDAAWVYPEPKEAARRIRNYVAFGKGVEVVP